MPDTFNTRWSWFLTLDMLSNGDRTQWEYFLQMNATELLNTMAFRKEKSDHELEQQRKMMNSTY